MTNDSTNSTQNSNNIVFFSFDGVDVQAVSRNGDAWFVGMEVAKALGYSDTDQAIRKHCKAAENLKPVELTGLGIVAKSPRGLKLIPERDLYRLVMNSEKPDALAFEEKVVGEVLPSIRKTGGYIAVAAADTPDQIMARAILVAQETISRQKSENDLIEAARAAAQVKVEELTPKAAALDLLAAKPGELGVRDAGRELHVGQKWVTDYIDGHAWSCIEGGRRKPAHYGLKHGYCRLVPENYRHPHTGEERVREEFRLTRRGIVRLAEIIAKLRKENGLVPFAPAPAKTA